MGGVRVVASAGVSSNFDKRYVVVDEATGEVVDDAQGYGYKSAQNAHRAHPYTSMPPKKKRQRDAAKRRVQRWCSAPRIHAARRAVDVLCDERRPERY
jgi:hypothetical protein